MGIRTSYIDDKSKAATTHETVVWPLTPISKNHPKKKTNRDMHGEARDEIISDVSSMDNYSATYLPFHKPPK